VDDAGAEYDRFMGVSVSSGSDNDLAELALKYGS
jgi:hypothetical protein